jgi:hypothetical protein
VKNMTTPALELTPRFTTNRSTTALAGLVLGGLLLTGCAPATTGTPATTGAPAPASSVPAGPVAVATQAPADTAPAGAAATIPVGPGPSPTYRVQVQPAPGSCHYRVLDAAAGSVLPDLACTPGATNPAVTPATLTSTICRSGYTAGIRPPENITSTEKTASITAYAYGGARTVVEYDHLISLELGGDPNDPRNLWPEPNAATATTFNNAKDAVESHLHALVCSGAVPLAVAQKAIASNWTTAVAVATGASS